MPGYVGLSVVHAFSYGLPVITCRTGENGPFHSPEIEYLKHDYNGLLLEESPEIISHAIQSLLKDEVRYEKQKQNTLKTAYDEYKLDRMISGFYEAIQYVSTDE